MFSFRSWLSGIGINHAWYKKQGRIHGYPSYVWVARGSDGSRKKAAAERTAGGGERGAQQTSGSASSATARLLEEQMKLRLELEMLSLKSEILQQTRRLKTERKKQQEEERQKAL